MSHSRPGLAHILLIAALALTPHQGRAQGKTVLPVTFATADDLYTAEVRLAECEDATGDIQRLPAPLQPTGLGAWLHTGSAFSVRTRFWADINRRLKDRPRPEEPADFDNLPPDEETRRAVLAQIVIGLVVEGELRLLVPNREGGRPLYRIACGPDQPLRAPDLYPTIEIRPNFRQNRTDGDQAAAFQRLLQTLRGDARAGRSLPFFAAAAPSPLPPHTRPLPARDRPAHIDYTVAVLDQKQAQFLTKVLESGSLRLLGVGGRAPGSTQVIVDRPPDAELTETPAAEGSGPGIVPRGQTAPAVQETAGNPDKVAELHLKRQLEAAQVSAGELMLEREELRKRLSQATADLEERNRSIERLAGDRAALEERIGILTEAMAGDGSEDQGPQRLAQRLQALGAEAERLRRDNTALVGETESLRASTDEALRKTEALTRELADRARSHRAMADSLQRQDEQLTQARQELADAHRDRDAAHRTLAAPGLRVRLPDVFASVDLQERLRITDGPCRDAILRRMPDLVSYESQGCTDVGPKTVEFGQTGIKPVTVTGLTADLRSTRLGLQLRLSGAAARGWSVHRGDERSPMLVAGDLVFQDVLAASDGRLRLRMFPEAPAGSTLDLLCSVEIPVTVADVLRGDVDVREEPPCTSHPVSDLPLGWFAVPASDAGEPRGQPFCIAAPTALVPWCAKLSGDTSDVTLHPGVGWLAQTVPADALTWETVRSGLRADWPYAGPNPAAPELADRPDYRLVDARYCSADGSSCCTVPTGRNGPPSMLLPSLGEEAACRGHFAPDRLPTTVQPTFAQPPDASAGALSYWPRFTDDPIEIAALGHGVPKVVAVDRLIGRYPVVALNQPFLPFAATNQIHFHRDEASCQAKPAAGIRPGVPYRAGGGALGFESDVRGLFAVLTDGSRALSHCSPAEAQRDSGAPAGVRAAVRLTVRVVPGRPAVVAVLPSERLGADGRDAVIRQALGKWLKGRSVVAATPLRVLAIDPEGGVRDIVPSGSLITDTDRIAGVVDEALAGLGFGGEARDPLRSILAVYRHLEAEQGEAGHEAMASLVLISDGSEPALRRSDLLALVAVTVADRSTVGIVTPGSCANWTRFDAVDPANCLEIGVGADDGAGRLLRFLEAMPPTAASTPKRP